MAMKYPNTNPIKSPTNLSSSSQFSLGAFVEQQQQQQCVIPFKRRNKKLDFTVRCSSQSSEGTQTEALISILRVIPDWADGVKERGMKRKRALYNHQKWVEHRSSLRHIRHLMSSLSSRVILSLVPPVIAFTSVAAFIASYNTAVILHWLPEFFPVLRASTLPYQLTAPALALLLVFRTEASYSRFEEGRKAWTKIIAGASDFSRQVIASVGNKNDAQLKKALLQFIVAFPIALKCHLLHGSDVAEDLKNLLDPDDLAIVLRSKHRPSCIIGFISQCIQVLHLGDTEKHMLESKISCFHQGLGVCEELMGIPVPLSYTRLTSRFLVLWHLTLPIILWDDCNWIVVPATFISAATLFCIEEVGVLIEEPFAMLALDELCNLVKSSIEEEIANEFVIRAQVNAKIGSPLQNKNHFQNGWPSSKGVDS